MRLLITICVCLFSVSMIAQDIDFEVNKDSVARFQPKDMRMDQILLKIAFAEDQIQNPTAVKNLRDALVRQVTLVYTSYALSPSFDQEALNARRIAALKELIPDLQDHKIRTKKVTQTGAVTPEEGKQYFHGFVIDYLRPDTDKDADDDLKYLKDQFDDTGHPEMTYNEDSSGMVRWTAEIHSKRRIKRTFKDSVVLSSIRRNNWEGVLLVADLTASMTQYIGQVMEYAYKRADSNDLYAYCFFNDGDGGAKGKNVGSTGGLYHEQYTNFPKLLIQSQECIRHRGRNDIEENDFEALLEGIKKYPESKEVVIIVDNRSPVRDFRLHKKIDRPVHIILGYYVDYVAQEYLQLAYKTGGTIHFKNIDLDFSNIENQTVRKGGKEYSVIDGVVYERYSIR